MTEHNYERAKKLLNLFAGVPDEQIDRLSEHRDAVDRLMFAVLTNPLESVPLAMLIDEIQMTPEYQLQLGCYRTWRELYDKLLKTGEELEVQPRMWSGGVPTATSRLGTSIREFLAPTWFPLI